MSEETRRRRRGSLEGAASSSRSWPTSSEFLRMENLIESLKLLDYDNEFCASKGFAAMDRFLFILPGQAQQQFPYFSALVSWSLTVANLSFDDWEFDDPTTASNNIVLALSKLGFSADFQPAKLKLGYGVPVLSVLEFVVQKALQSRAIRVEKPVYHATTNSSNARQDDVIEEDLDANASEDDLELDDDDDDDIMYNDLMKGNSGGRGGDDDDDGNDSRKESVSNLEVLESQVDPAEWKLELERVTPMLRFKSALAFKEWMSHLEQTRKHIQVVNENWPQLAKHLHKIGRDMSDIAERISSKERHIKFSVPTR